MKKIIVVSALMMGVFGLVGATANATSSMVCAESSVMSMQNDGFIPAKLEELPKPVQEAILKLGESYTVKSLAWNPEKEQTKVIVLSKKDNSQGVVVLDKEGKAVKEVE